jgi:hypothetical protein
VISERVIEFGEVTVEIEYNKKSSTEIVVIANADDNSKGVKK